MSKAYEFFEHTADIGVYAYGTTMEEVFRNAAAAMFDTLGQLKKAKEGKRKKLDLHADSLEDLLHDWLAELLYEVEANHVLYDELAITKLTSSHLVATLTGKAIDFARSQTNEEVKAVTYHHLHVEQLTDRTWQATVIFDV